MSSTEKELKGNVYLRRHTPWTTAAHLSFTNSTNSTTRLRHHQALSSDPSITRIWIICPPFLPLYRRHQETIRIITSDFYSTITIAGHPIYWKEVVWRRKHVAQDAHLQQIWIFHLRRPLGLQMMWLCLQNWKIVPVSYTHLTLPTIYSV